jgi:hypothetical protein
MPCPGSKGDKEWPPAQGLRLPGAPATDPDVQFSRIRFLGRTRFRASDKFHANGDNGGRSRILTFG